MLTTAPIRVILKFLRRKFPVRGAVTGLYGAVTASSHAVGSYAVWSRLSCQGLLQLNRLVPLACRAPPVLSC